MLAKHRISKIVKTHLPEYEFYVRYTYVKKTFHGGLGMVYNYTRAKRLADFNIGDVNLRFPYICPEVILLPKEGASSWKTTGALYMAPSL
jgi:hypothetical protein